jgi:hypothetical protein
MTLGDLQEEVLRQIAAYLASAGYRRREQSFVRDNPDGFWAVHVAFIPHRSDFDLTLDVAIRHNVVEERLDRTFAHLAPRDRRKTASIGVELGNYAEGQQHRWTIRQSVEVSPIVADMLKHYRQLGVPILERFSSLAELARVLEEDGREASLICPLLDVRAEVREVARKVLSERAA